MRKAETPTRIQKGEISTPEKNGRVWKRYTLIGCATLLFFGGGFCIFFYSSLITTKASARAVMLTGVLRSVALLTVDFHEKHGRFPEEIKLLEILLNSEYEKEVLRDPFSPRDYFGYELVTSPTQEIVYLSSSRFTSPIWMISATAGGIKTSSTPAYRETYSKILADEIEQRSAGPDPTWSDKILVLLERWRQKLGT